MTSPVLQRQAPPLTSPAVFDFWAGQINPLWSWSRTLARVVERHPASRDAVTLVLQPNRHFAGFTLGQHLNVTAEVNGRRVSRSYSLTGLPRKDGCVSITVKEVPGGTLSPFLCHKAVVGTVLELGAAFGELQLSPERQDQKHLLLAAGSGITPLMALVRMMAAAGMPGDLTLLYWARARDEVCFAGELAALAATYPAFRVCTVLTREAEPLPQEQTGRLEAGLLARCVPDLADRHVTCCGPAGFVSTALALTADTARSFQAESFTPATAVANGTASETVKVFLSASRRTLEVPVGVSLLSALEAQGVQPDYGCRMGICNTCACGKAVGVTQDMSNGDISHEPTSALRLCISRATTDLTLDL